MADRSTTIPADQCDDPSVIGRIAAGDTRAFELLMRRDNRRQDRLARAILRDPAEAEDALQDAYLDAYRSIGRFRGESAVATWLSRLVINECLGRTRREARRQNVIPIDRTPGGADFDAIKADESGSPDRAADRAQVRAILERRMDELPESFRLVLILRSVEELSVQETAQCLGLPEETVRTRHFRARTLLRESLARELDLAERDVFEFGGDRCDRLIARVLPRLVTPSA
jgi:RNA polymerase sigma-70 factor (ECF subfamily)